MNARGTFRDQARSKFWCFWEGLRLGRSGSAGRGALPFGQLRRLEVGIVFYLSLFSRGCEQWRVGLTRSRRNWVVGCDRNLLGDEHDGWAGGQGPQGGLERPERELDRENDVHRKRLPSRSAGALDEVAVRIVLDTGELFSIRERDADLFELDAGGLRGKVWRRIIK